MAEYICTACGYEGPGRKRKRGSGRAELMIWTMVLIPGPFYSFYRRIGLKRECTHCNLPHVVNIKSDAGFIAKRKIDIELGVVEILKVVPKNVVESFGNDRLTEKKETKKPVNPEEW